MDLFFVTLFSCLLMVQGKSVQDSPRPVLPKSFSFNASLEFYGGAARASFAVDFTTGNLNLKIFFPSTCPGEFGVLTRYDIGSGLTFGSTMIGEARACLPLPAGSKPTTGTFDWLETAVYQGQSTELTGKPLDIWASSSGGKIGEFRLGVSPTNSNQPEALYINGDAPVMERMFRIEGIDPSPPSASAFTIPDYCPQSLEEPTRRILPMLPPFFMGKL